jgi:sugar phosphate isomerase/epimerase
MTTPLFVHIPAHLLATRLPFLLNRNLQPEVACQEVQLENLDLAELRDCAAQLTAAGLRTCLHAPFTGFDPGSPKNRLQKKSHQLAKRSLELAEVIAAERIVFHPGLASRSPTKEQSIWLQHSLDFWPEHVARAEQIGSLICIENIFESTPEPLLQLCQGLESPAFGHCFDIGHWNMFATGSLEGWFGKLGGQIRHLHLHDNHGESDEHLPIGRGAINFAALFALVDKLETPPSMTLEAHNLVDLDISLTALQDYFPNR